MDPALWELLEEGDLDEEVATVIRLQRPDRIPPGVRIVSQFGDIATCRLKRGDILDVRANENVESMKSPRLFIPEHDLDLPGVSDFGETVRESDERRPAGEHATGEGVVVGVIDWGIDFAHPDFLHEDGTTRLLALWDQRARPVVSKSNSYGYGEIYDSQRINRALTERDPYAALDYHPADADLDRSGSHGTHVMSIAAGSGRGGGSSGVAPEADLVFVHLSMWGQEDQSRLGDSVTIIEAVDFIAHAAGSRPWVLNMSLGRHAGPHDGTTLVEQALDAALLTAPGRAIVQSAGNYFDRRAHAAGQLRPGELHTLTWITDEADKTPNEIDIWYPGQDQISIELRSPDGVRSRRVQLGERESIKVNGREVGNVYNRARDPNNLHNQINVFLYVGAPAGEWEVTLVGDDIVDGRFHAWIERDAGCRNCQSQFEPQDAVTSTTTGTICNGFRTIAVGAYNAHSPSFEIAPFSSGGPTRDGRIKPDLVAPGVGVLGARSSPRHRHAEDSLLTRKSGTSMAAPHVAGTVALMHQVAARPLQTQELRKLLLTATRAIPASADLVVRIGSGILDTERALTLTRRFFEEHRPTATIPTKESEAATVVTAAVNPTPKLLTDTTPATRVATVPREVATLAAKTRPHVSEIFSGTGQCEFVQPGDLLSAASQLSREPTEHSITNRPTEGVNIMSSKEDHECACSKSQEDIDEAAKSRNFILLSGGPGPYDDRDIEHDASWANYVTPPLLLPKFWEKEEDVWWFVYKPAYEMRWKEDSSSKHMDRKAAVKAVKDKGFKSYVDMIAGRAKSKGWHLSWLSNASDFWKKLKTFNDPIARVWYWGHARNDLWLTIGHDSSGTAIAPSSSAIIKISSIDSSIASRFQAGNEKRVHRFVGCNTKAFAEAWAKNFAVWAEGIEDKISFISISKTGGEPCLVGTAKVFFFNTSGSSATPSSYTSPYKTCADLGFAEVLETDESSEPEEIPEWKTEDEVAWDSEHDTEYDTEHDTEHDTEYIPPAYAGDSGEVEETRGMDESYEPEAPSFVEIAEASIADRAAGVSSPSALLTEIMDQAGYGSSLNPLGTGNAISPAVIFDALAPGGAPALRNHFSNIFEIVAGPGESFSGQLLPGDLLVRRALGEGSLTNLAMVVTGEMVHSDELAVAGLNAEGNRPGLYAQVIEMGAFPVRTHHQFARRLADENGRVSYDQMVLRVYPDAYNSGGAVIVPSRTGGRQFLTECAPSFEAWQEEAPDVCIPGEGPPAAVPDPAGKGPHPLIKKGQTKKLSRNPSVGDAQQLLNRWLKLTETSLASCDNQSAEALAFITRGRKTLQKNGQDPLIVDCRFGPSTDTATKMFQACKGLVRDGDIGPLTWTQLIKLRTKIQKVEVHPSDTDTHKIASVLGVGGKDHFCCVKNTGDVILQATVTPDLQVARDEVVWEADGAVVTSPAVGTDPTTVKLSSVDSKKIPIRIKVRGTTVYEAFVWVIWSNAASTAAGGGITSPPAFLEREDGTVTDGVLIQSEQFDFTFTITPPEIITDADRPDLAGVNTVAVPGAALTHVVSNSALAAGADKKWDASRHIRVKVLNPKLLSVSGLHKVDGHMWDGQPAASTTPEAYPADKALGNDDTTTGDGTTGEDNDPYNDSGTVKGNDRPRIGMPHNTGSNGDTFEVRFHFIEFLRVNLDTKWYRASDDFPWRMHFRYKRVSGKWIDNGSSQELNNTGF